MRKDLQYKNHCILSLHLFWIAIDNFFEPIIQSADLESRIPDQLNIKSYNVVWICFLDLTLHFTKIIVTNIMNADHHLFMIVLTLQMLFAFHPLCNTGQCLTVSQLYSYG